MSKIHMRPLQTPAEVVALRVPDQVAWFRKAAGIEIARDWVCSIYDLNPEQWQRLSTYAQRYARLNLWSDTDHSAASKIVWC